VTAQGAFLLRCARAGGELAPTPRLPDVPRRLARIREALALRSRGAQTRRLDEISRGALTRARPMQSCSSRRRQRKTAVAFAARGAS